MEIIKLFGNEGLPRDLLRNTYEWMCVEVDDRVDCHECGNEMFEGDEYIEYDRTGNCYCSTGCGRRSERNILETERR